MKNIFKIILVLVVFVSLSFVNTNTNEINIVIDAGHGGHDTGALTTGVTEKDITNAICNKIKALNTNANIKLHFTRNDDSFVSLQERVDFINAINPDLVLSLHVYNNNSLKNDAYGFEIFIPQNPKNDQAKSLALNLETIFTESLPLKNRGINTAPFFLLKKSEAPTMILEMGFLSNKNDKEYITSEEGQNQIAETILKFISSVKK